MRSNLPQPSKMAEDGSSPGLYRIGTLTHFLPLADNSITTRGQSLPGLVASRSGTNISALWSKSFRRGSTAGAEDLSHRGHESDGDYETDERRRRRFSTDLLDDDEPEDRRRSAAATILMTPQMRSQRLIGNSNPRYRWERYWKTEQQLEKMRKPIRKYYQRTNELIQHYMYIDRLLDSSLPHELIQEYQQVGASPAPGARTFHPSDVPMTITEEPTPIDSPGSNERAVGSGAATPPNGHGTTQKIKRTPNNIYRHKDLDESTPLLKQPACRGDEEQQIMPPDLEPEEETGSQSRIVQVAIWVTFVANLVLLIMKIIVAALTSSVSIFASLVDAALDFLSSAIVWTSTYLIASSDQYAYPIGRRRLEPVGVLVFSVIMCTAFFQVAIQGLQELYGSDHTVVKLTIPTIAIMASTVAIKLAAWFWCRLIKNSSVQALAQDAMTDVIFNTFSIVFPLIGFYAKIWWLDPLGGVLLSFYVIGNWAHTSTTHIRNLTGCAASADERNILLYLTMRFAKTIKQIQGLQAYHSGDKLNVEVDLVLDENTNLRDSHDLGESLQYVIESVPNGEFIYFCYYSGSLSVIVRCLASVSAPT